MRTYNTAFFGKADEFQARALKDGGVRVSLSQRIGQGGELVLFFDTQEDADRLADVIFYAKMDRDADAMQADEAATL